MARVAMVRGVLPSELMDSARLAETVAGFISGAEGMKWRVGCDLTVGATKLVLEKRGQRIAVVVADQVSRYRFIRMLLEHARAHDTRNMMMMVMRKNGSAGVAKEIGSA